MCAHPIDTLSLESFDESDVAVSDGDPGQTSEQRDKVDLKHSRESVTALRTSRKKRTKYPKTVAPSLLTRR